MNTTTDDYLVKEACKVQATLLKLIDDMKEEIESIDAQLIANSPNRISNEGADLLVMLHEKLGELNKNLGMWRMVTLIFSILSKPKEASDEIQRS